MCLLSSNLSIHVEAGQLQMTQETKNVQRSSHECSQLHKHERMESF